MKLFYAPRSPFALKVRILIHELGTTGIELVATDPWSNGTLRAANPLCKIPTLILDQGEVLYDSPVICEYLDHLAGGRTVPVSGVLRWRALRRQALSDGLAEAIIRRFVERLGPANDRSDAVAQRQDEAITSTLDTLEGEALSFDHLSSIGEIATAAALTYLTFRSPEIAWRLDRPALAAWYDAVSLRPSMLATRIVPPSSA